MKLIKELKFYNIIICIIQIERETTHLKRFRKEFWDTKRKEEKQTNK